MSEIHSAARHLELQRRLEELHGRLSALLAGFPGEQGDSGGVRELPSLPRLSVVVCGVPGSGKSALVADLLGLAPEERAGSAGRQVVIHRHAGAVPGLQLGIGRVERFHDLDVLRNLDIIDTPEVESSGFGDSGGMVRGADLLLVVFPPEDVWHAGTWSLLTGLSRDLLGRTGLVVAGRGGAGAAGADLAARHAADLALRKIGVALRVFVWGEGGNDEEISGWFYAVLRARPARERGWRKLRDGSRELIRIAWERACERERDVAGRLRRLAAIETLAREDGEEWVRARCADPSAEEIVVGEFQAVRSLVRRSGGVWASVWRLFAGDRCMQETGAAFAMAFERGVRAVFEADRKEAADWGAAYWDLVADGIARESGQETPGYPGLPASLAEVDEFLPAAAPVFHGELVRLRECIGGMHRSRGRLLSLPVGAVLLCISAAAVCGIFGRDAWAIPLLQAAAGFLVLVPVVAWVSRWRMSTGFDREIRRSARDLVPALAAVRRDALRGAVASCARAVAASGGSLRAAMDEIATVGALRAEIAGILAVSSEADA